jgi:hypothetical protein
VKLTHALRRRWPVALMIVTLVAGTGLAAATAGAAGPAPVTLSPGSGPAGTTITVTLPISCGSGIGSSTLELDFRRVGGGPGSTFVTVPVGVGGTVRQAYVTVPTTATAGTYTMSGFCFRPFTTATTYGPAFFKVTGGPPLPVLTVTPATGPVGTIVDIAGPCAAAGRPTATFAVAMFNRSDPRSDHVVFAAATGAGPVLHARLRVPAFFAIGEATITATCLDYQHEQTFTEASFMVQGNIAVSVGDSTVVEGRSGARAERFAVTLSEPTNEDVSVSYITAGGDATGGSDYATKAGVATIPAGATATSITVDVRGDTKAEPKESFGLWLADPHGGHLGRAVGVGRIIDDDPSTGVRVAIGDASLVEGKRGTRSLRIPVTLSSASAGAVSVHYATANGTARSGSDYNAVSGNVTIAAGKTSGIVTVPIRVDAIVEANEAFTVRLSAPSGATIGRTTGVATIRDDDQA